MENMGLCLMFNKSLYLTLHCGKEIKTMEGGQKRVPHMRPYVSFTSRPLTSTRTRERLAMVESLIEEGKSVTKPLSLLMWSPRMDS